MEEKEIEFTCPVCHTHRAIPGLYVIKDNNGWGTGYNAAVGADVAVCPPGVEVTENNIIKAVNSINWSIEVHEQFVYVYIIKDNGEVLTVSGSFPDGISCNLLLPELNDDPEEIDRTGKDFVILKKPETVKEMTDILISFFKYGDNPKIVGDDLIWNQEEYDNKEAAKKAEEEKANLEAEEAARKAEEEKLIQTAENREKYLDFDAAIKIYEQIGKPEEAKRVRKLKIDMASPRTIVEGNFVDDRDTIIKDSVINRSNVGVGWNAMAKELREAKALLEEGLINENEYEKMKKEILGK